MVAPTDGILGQEIPAVMVLLARQGSAGVVAQPSR